MENFEDDVPFPWFKLKNDTPYAYEPILVFNVETNAIGIDVLHDDPEDDESLIFHREWTHWLPLPNPPAIETEVH